MEEIGADKTFYYICKGVQKLELSKKVFIIFNNILMKVRISFPVEIFNFGSL